MAIMGQGRLKNSVVELKPRKRPPRKAIVGDGLTAPHPPSPPVPPHTAPAVPRWAMEMTSGTTSVRQVMLQLADQVPGGTTDVACDVVVRTGRDAVLVSVGVDGVGDWTAASLEATVQEMIGLSLNGLRETAFAEPVRSWNFVPGICTPIGVGLDRYRVFNIARHRAFAARFGDAAIGDGRLPTASCVGHQGLTLATHILGARRASVPVENPRQVSAYAYSLKYGPRPPCFSRAGLVEVEGRRLLLVAGTASVRGEESVHDGSLEEQLRETVVNLRAVVAQGRRVGGVTHGEEAPAPLKDVRATRVYYRRCEDLAWLKRALPRELVKDADVEFVHADICRDELLVEIEIVVDVARV